MGSYERLVHGDPGSDLLAILFVILIYVLGALIWLFRRASSGERSWDHAFEGAVGFILVLWIAIGPGYALTWFAGALLLGKPPPVLVCLVGGLVGAGILAGWVYRDDRRVREMAYYVGLGLAMAGARVLIPHAPTWLLWTVGGLVGVAVVYGATLVIAEVRENRAWRPRGSLRR